MDERNGAQLQTLAHDSAVHAALLMDLLRMVDRIDPQAFQHGVRQVERELRESSTQGAPLHGRAAHSVLEHRLAFLRSVQIQSAVGLAEA
jgi:hypothetical protein